MSPGKGIILTSLIIPGLIIIGTSIYLFNRDYSALVRSENNLSRLVRQNRTSNRRLDFVYHRTRVQRISVVTDQAWGLIGGIITAIGIHGLVTMDDERDNRESRGERR